MTIYGVSINYFSISLTKTPLWRRRHYKKHLCLIWTVVSDVLFIRKICCITIIKRERLNGTPTEGREIWQLQLIVSRNRLWIWSQKSILLENDQPFISDNSSFNTNKIILQEGDIIINDTGEICEIFNNYYTSVASNIDFDDTIPTDFDTDDGFSAFINKYCRHPSIVEIRENALDKALFDFESITHRDVEKIINGFDSKKAHGYDKMPMKLLQKSANYIAPDIAKWINNSFS